MASRNTRKRSALRAETARKESERQDVRIYVEFLSRMGVTEGDPEFQTLLSEAQEVGFELFFGDEL
jgi:hypothetical protein